ncbi:MAG: hypothetical protein ACQEXB_18335 [Bacillota bacterium]
MKNLAITIRYNSPAGRVLQQGDFPLKGRKPEQVALDWWKQIQKDVYTDELIEVTANGEDITDKIRALLNE